MHHCKSLGFWSYQEYFSNPMGPPSLLHYTFIVKNKLGHSHVALLGFLESKSNREQISVVRYVLLLCASAASWSGRGQIPMSMTQCVLFRLISHESWDHRGSCIQFGTGAHKGTFYWYFKISNKDLHRDRTQMMTSLIFEDNPWDPIFYVILTVCFALVFTVVMVLHYLMCCFIRVDPLNLCAANRWSNDLSKYKRWKCVYNQSSLLLKNSLTTSKRLKWPIQNGVSKFKISIDCFFFWLV